MKIPQPPIHFTLHVLMALLLLSANLQAQLSSLVYPGPDGKLDYATYANEGQSNSVNKMIDFSHAGYKGGGTQIPWVPVVIELSPQASGDDFGRIQSAIDTIGNMPLSSSGFRGTLLLKAGSYRVSQTLQINKSGIVIRGEGQNSAGTVVNFTATVQDNLFEFNGVGGWGQVGTETAITDSFVPSGVRSFNVASSSGFSVGDRIIVHRTPNQAWIDLITMAQWGWTPDAYKSQSPRTITAINGNQITIDAPTVHTIESRYGGAEIYPYSFGGAVTHVGIERIRLISAYNGTEDEAHGWTAVKFNKVENAWARQVSARYFGYSCVSVVSGSQYVTVEDCAQLDPKSIITGARRYSFSLDDCSYVLIQRCFTREGRHDYVSGSKTIGPNVFVDCLAENTHSDIEPHHRYTEGILFDNVMGDNLKVQNREDSGSGHGWAGAQTVFWNCHARQDIICDAPKGAMNFAIGCVGNKAEGSSWWAPEEPFGIWESHQTHVTPRSLYYKQLEDRLGNLALLNVTTTAQRAGGIWNDLSSWAGRAAFNLPPFVPVQVSVGNDFQASNGGTYQLDALVQYPLPDSFPILESDWSIVSSAGNVSFNNLNSQSTEATFQGGGTYELRYTYTQVDDTDPQNIITYSDNDTIVITVDGPVIDPGVDPVDGTYMDVEPFTSIGSISGATSALSFNTDTLQVSGGLSGTGELVDNPNGSEVAVFAFNDVDLTAQPTISGSRPFVLMSKNNLRVAADVNVNGGNGGHAVHGVGIAGGGSGGDANRSDSPGNPYDGQGSGGSAGNSSGIEDSTSGGGGFGGAGGAGTGAGGSTYGDENLSSLLGGSGAGGTRNKGGGAGGGAIAFIAANSLEITGSVTLNSNGGSGSSSGSQYTSGGGSGGSIVLHADTVTVNGNLNANGGNGGNASGGQLNGGGGGGGRIAVYYRTLDLSGSSINASGGVPVGTNSTGKSGADGTIAYIEMDSPTLENVALNKPASQSTTNGSYVASNGVDGIIGGGTSNITHTTGQTDPWWEVDLQGSFDVAEVKLYNRSNCCQERLDNYYVFVKDSPFTGTTITEYQAEAAGWYQGGPMNGVLTDSALFTNTRARYIRIALEGDNRILSLEEVEVFGALLELNDYDNWKSIHSITDDLGDDDGDGISNLAEFALGGNPNSASGDQRPVVIENGNQLEFNFRRNEATVTYVIQKSTDLVNWTDHVTVNDSHGAVGSDCSVPVSMVEMNNGKLFLRLRVEN